MRTLLFTLLIAITSGAQMVEIIDTINNTTNDIDLAGRNLVLVFDCGKTNTVSPTGWHEHYYTEQECIDRGLDLSCTNRLWWMHTEEPATNASTPYILVQAWEAEGEYELYWTDDLMDRWYTLVKFNAGDSYFRTIKVLLPTNSPVARRVLESDTGFIELSTWNSNFFYSVDVSNLVTPSTGGGGTGGGGGPPPPPGG